MSRFKLRGHQKYALEVMNTNPSLGIFYAIGCGKTMIILSWIKYALKAGLIKDALIVCPASLVASWHQAIKDLIKFEGYDTHTIERMKEAITITSFQKTWKTEKKVQKNRGGAMETRKKLALREEVDKKWGAVIVDESHSIGSHSSNQTKAAVALGMLARYRFILSGTPVHGGGGSADFSKLYGQLQFLTKGELFKNWTDFCRKYVTSFNHWKKPVRYDEKACRKLMQDWGIACRLEDCEDMPDKVEQEIPCELAEPKMYRDVREGNVEAYGLVLENAGSQYNKMLQICSGSCKVSDTNTLKLKCSKDDALGDILNGTQDPVVIFCKFRASVDRCVAVAKKAKRKVVSFDGRSKGPVWMQLVDGEVDTLVCQYNAGSSGLNLQVAHVMVLFEPDFSSLVMEQAMGRIYRKGQTSKCVYYFLYTIGTIEKKVLTTVRSGKDVSNEMLMRWGMEDTF